MFVSEIVDQLGQPCAGLCQRLTHFLQVGLLEIEIVSLDKLKYKLFLKGTAMDPDCFVGHV